MRPRDERAHPVVQDALDKGHLDTGADYHVPGLPSHEVANQTRISINRALGHFGMSPASRVVDQQGQACFKSCQDPDAPHGVTFRLWSKDGARQHVIHQSGGNPENLKYNPFAKQSGRVVDDAGNRISG